MPIGHRQLDLDSPEYRSSYNQGKVILLQGIHPQATDQDLAIALWDMGILHACIHWPRNIRTQCILEFSDPTEADTAIINLDGHRFHRQKLSAEVAPVPPMRRARNAAAAAGAVPDQSQQLQATNNEPIVTRYSVIDYMTEQNQGLLEAEDDTSPPVFDTFFSPKEWKNDFISEKGGWKEFYGSYATHVPEANIRKDKDGALMFPACQYASPTSMDHDANNTVHVAMAKGQYDTSMSTTLIKVYRSEDIAGMERDGWTLWKHPRQEWKRRHQLLQDGKLREYEQQRRQDNKTGWPMEKMNHQAPQHDTKNLFKREISLLEGSETTSTWQPGELLGPSADLGTNPSLSDVFKPADEFVDKRSATFIGYAHEYFREPTGGLGWGGYDRFQEWQSYGREIPKDEVKKEYGSTGSAQPLRFVDYESGNSETVAEIENDSGSKAPSTLFERMILRERRSRLGRLNF